MMFSREFFQECLLKSILRYFTGRLLLRFHPIHYRAFHQVKFISGEFGVEVLLLKNTSPILVGLIPNMACNPCLTSRQSNSSLYPKIELSTATSLDYMKDIFLGISIYLNIHLGMQGRLMILNDMHIFHR